MESLELKELLRNRGLAENNGDQGRTLYCISFRSGAAICTRESNRGRGNHTEKKQYQSLLNVNGEQLSTRSDYGAQR